MPESPPVRSIGDRARKLIRLFTRRSHPSSILADGRTAAEFFSNAQDFTINGGNFIKGENIINSENIINELQIYYTNDVVSSGKAVFELLEPYTCLDATKDSSARYPPPKCHPETRLKIRERLTRWLSNEREEQRMFWVRGSAGTGKSAVAQSFGDSCEKEENFGASYFFSRVANRNKLETVVPTLVYQLVTNVPGYRSLIEQRFAQDPLLLRNSPPVQFRKLIVEPFATLHRQHPRKPIVIILDGLDECEGEGAQCEIIEMITNAIRSNAALPLRWLIFSRPEAHLKHTFSRNLLCGREELIIDAECWENVERYVKDRLVEIKEKYQDITPPEWPPQDKLEELLDAVSGLFVLASTCLNFIGDPDEADPPSRLDSLLTFMRRSQGVMLTNPLATLDLLYSRILEKTPPTVFVTTRRILGYMCYRSELDAVKTLDSAQALSNFLRLDQRTFYKAVRGLHSVMSIPEGEEADKKQLQFYHASFQDFLLDPNRSNKFAIDEQDALLDAIQVGIYWADVDVTHFHINDGCNFDLGHGHDSLPGLTWASEDNQSSFSRSITEFIDLCFFHPAFDMQLNVANEGLLSQISSIDFRHWSPWIVYHLARHCQLDPSTSIVRVEPSSPADHQLFEYFNLMIGNGIAKPAIMPPRFIYPASQWIREYFFIGHGAQSVIVWITKSPPSSLARPYSLCCDSEPSETHKSAYAKYLQDINWDEEKAKLEMG